MIESLERWRPPVWARLITVRDANSFDPNRVADAAEIYVVTSIAAEGGGEVRVWKADEINQEVVPAAVERICSRLAEAGAPAERVICVGVEAPGFSPGDGMSADVAEGVLEATHLIVRRMSLRALASAA